MASYNLNATSTPAIQVPSTYLDPSLGTPTTSPAFPPLTSASDIGAKLRALSAGVDALGRAGGGGYGVAFGLDLTVSSGLVLAISAGQALLDATVTKAAGTLALSNNITRIYLWLGQNGTLTPVSNSLTPPAGAQVFLGSIVTSGGAITEIDYSGRVQVLRGGLWTRYADAGVPGNTPPATITFDALTVGGLYHWDGLGWQAYGGAISAGLANTSDVAQGDALLGYKSPLTGGVARTVHARLADLILSVKDFGATGDGTTADGVAIQAAINAAPSGATIYFPPGTYNITSAASWLHTDGVTTKFGLVASNKRLNFRGAGSGSLLIPGSNNVDVLTLINPASDVFNTGTNRCLITDLAIRNTTARTGCNAIVMDRAHRNRIENCTIGNSADSTRFAAGIKYISSFIQDCAFNYIHKCTRGIDCETYYTSGPAWDGPSHGLMIQGGEIQDNVIGIYLKDQEAVGVSRVVIEGNSTHGVFATGSGSAGTNRLNVDGCYFEQAGTGVWDVELAGLWHNARIDGAYKVKARSGFGLALSNFRDTAGGSRGNSALDVDSSVANVVFLNTWWAESEANAFRTDAWNAFEQGIARFYSQGVPKANITPREDIGPELLRNGEMAFASGGVPNGWTSVSGFAQSTTSPPFGLDYSLATTTTGAAVKLLDSTVPFDNSLRGRTVCLSCWVKIPNTSWVCNLGLTDGTTTVTFNIDDAVKDNTWRRVSAQFLIGATLTTLGFRVAATTAGSGTFYVAGASMTLGQIPNRPLMPGHRLPASMPVRWSSRTVRAVDTNDQFDPTDGGTQYIQGAGANKTLNAAQATIINSTVWRQGMRIRWVADPTGNAFNVTFTSNATTKLRLAAATRTVVVAADVAGYLEVEYSGSLGLWCEIGFG